MLCGLVSLLERERERDGEIQRTSKVTNSRSSKVGIDSLIDDEAFEI